MYLNRFWLVTLVCLISFGAATSLPVMAANSDSQTAKSAKAAAKTSAKSEPKKVVKSSKKSKTVRTTVTRPSEPVVPARPSFATALGLRGQHDDLSLQSSVAMVVNQDTKTMNRCSSLCSPSSQSITDSMGSGK